MKANDDCEEEKYKKIVRKADKLFDEKSLIESKEVYKEALAQRPKDQYVIDRIKEIDDLLAKQKSSDQLYKDYITQADKKFNEKNYVLSKELYKRAQALKPNEPYPPQRIAEIDKLLAQKNQQEQQQQQQQQQQTAAAAKQKQDKFNDLVKQADDAIKLANYDQAKTALAAAAVLFPDSDYPKAKLKEIDDAIKSKAKDKETQFNNLLDAADEAFSDRNYQSAKDNYKRVLELKPDHKYSKDKIATIDALMSNKQKQEAEAKARADAYNQAIIEADN